ncbi:hypothetical protein [Prevotella sp. 885]|uniref:hypothetical protein n=1 Tax=Prevotella sp. 885 TaxID=2022527 RepID=UPI000BA13D4C|nr:hypothetical protein [Prevotella sp. 885]OZT04972.1 hypothetical protein CHL74_01930 [Prevotella sp. 885]
MFEKILAGLKTKFPGVDSKILERIAKKKAETTTTEEEVKTVVDGVTFQSIIESEGDRRANEAQTTAITNYEKKYKLKDGKSIQQPEPPKPEPPTGGASDEVKQMFAKMEQENKAMREQLDGILQEREGNQRKAKFEALFEGASDKLKERYLRNYDRLSFKDDDDFNGWLDTQKPFIESDIKEEKASGAAATPPLGGNRRKPGEAVDPAVTAYLNSEAKRESQTASPAIIGLSQGAPTPPPAQ